MISTLPDVQFVALMKAFGTQTPHLYDPRFTAFLKIGECDIAVYYNNEYWYCTMQKCSTEQLACFHNNTVHLVIGQALELAWQEQWFTQRNIDLVTLRQVKTLLFYVMHYHDLDELIQEHFGIHQWSRNQDIEMARTVNGSHSFCDVDGTEYEDSEPPTIGMSAREALERLCAQRAILPGNYLLQTRP